MPQEGRQVLVKGVQRGVFFNLSGMHCEQVGFWIGIDRVADVVSRNICSGGGLQCGAGCPWSATQSKISLSAAIGAMDVACELFGESRQLVLRNDASACKGALLRANGRVVKHSGTKQLWVQDAIQS